MSTSDTIRFLAHEAARCRDRDTCEAFCLLLPALCRVLNLKPLDDVAALIFERDFHHALRKLNASPLVEAHCETCGFADTVAESRFELNAQVSGWCDQCGVERHFAKREAVSA